MRAAQQVADYKNHSSVWGRSRGKKKAARKKGASGCVHGTVTRTRKGEEAMAIEYERSATGMELKWKRADRPPNGMEYPVKEMWEERSETVGVKDTAGGWKRVAG